MSRHSIKGYNDQYVITVGWDSPLATYFAHVLPQEECDYGDHILWVGTSEGEVPAVELLKSLLSEHAEIPQATCEALESDREKEKITSTVYDRYFKNKK